MVRECFEDAQILAEPHGVAVTLAACEKVEVSGDRHRLRQLLLNLADNAVKYNQPGGSVALALRRAGGFAEITVANTGPGIPPELQARVFERFVRGTEARSRAADGCGLGLTICQWIVVSITSPANGASFPAPYTGPITATTTNPAAAITAVQFFAGARLLGTVTAPPYSQPVNLFAGGYSLTARAIDYLGASNTSVAVPITVNSGVVAPAITQQPANLTVTVGSSVSFTVVATGTAPLRYQWSKNQTIIPGATLASYTIAGAAATDAGSYSVVVTNIAGSATSATATLAVNPVSTTPVVTVTASDASASESDHGTGTFRVARTGSTTDPLIVYYGLAGTATNGVDYEVLPGYATFPAGAATAEITVTPIPDSAALLEGNETVIMQIIAPPAGQAPYDLGKPDTATVTIADATTSPGNRTPTVKWVHPKSGQKFVAPANIVLVARARDRDGVVVQVEFFAGTNSLGFGIPVPKEDDDEYDASRHEEEDGDHHSKRSEEDDDNDLYVLVLTSVPEGHYTLTVRATDDRGATETSRPLKLRLWFIRNP